MEQMHRPGRVGRLLASRWMSRLMYVVAAGALAYVLLNIRFSDLARDASQMIWWPLVLAVVLQLVPRALQAWRWTYLLRPARVRCRLLFHAIYVAAFMNGVLPFCPSDLVRGVWVAKRAHTGTARVFTSLAVERVADGIALGLVTWLAVRDLRLPAALDHAVLAFLALIGAGVGIGIILVARHRRLRASISRRDPGGRVGRRLKRVSLDILSGIQAVKGWTMPMAVSIGIIIALTQVATLWLMLYAYRLHLSPFQAAALFGIISIGTLIPNAPSRIGSWQFFCILGLSVLGVPATRAAGFSVIAFALWTLPSLLIGGVAMLLSPVSWASLRTGRTTTVDARNAATDRPTARVAPAPIVAASPAGDYPLLGRLRLRGRH